MPDQPKPGNHLNSTADHEHAAPDHDQLVIDSIGREGTVTTPAGETSLGTTSIGVGSLASDRQQKDTAVHSMEQITEDTAASDREPVEDPHQPSSRYARL
jgi:hypothetical protein